MPQKRGTRSEVAVKWRERIARWRRQQCSITDFCRRERISQPSFFLWRRRIESEETARQSSNVPPRGAAFIPVQLVAPAHSAARPAGEPTMPISRWLEISCGEVTCRVPAEVEESTLRRVVRVLATEASS